MPLLLQLDIALLSASVAVSAALLIVALGTGLQRDVNRWFTLFIAMVLTWTVTMLLMRAGALVRGTARRCCSVKSPSSATRSWAPSCSRSPRATPASSRRWPDALAMAAFGIVGLRGSPCSPTACSPIPGSCPTAPWS